MFKISKFVFAVLHGDSYVRSERKSRELTIRKVFKYRYLAMRRSEFAQRK